MRDMHICISYGTAQSHACADCVRGTSNSFGVPYEPTPSDLSPSVDDLIHHGETTWEVSCVPDGPRWGSAAAQRRLRG